MNRNSVEEIERAITDLTPSEREELLLWMDQQYSQAIDDRLRTDLLTGRFDGRLDRALADDQAGKTRSL